ncbi:MAG TPA: PHB depolymerase family esterase [Candidatus Limnocylindrales bacterium]
MNLSLKALWGLLAALTLTVAAMIAAPEAKAASLVEVTGFGTNPSNLRMYLYVPDNVAARPGVLVAVHYCTGSGPAFHSGTEFARLADQYGFIVVYPSATRSGSCFDVSTAASLRHDGGSDSMSIVSMVRWVLQNRAGDPSRVYATGASSGGMMTNVLLGAYPDVFKAGAAFMGVPFACFATTDGSMWNSACANGQIIRTPQQWGDLVRGAFPGFTGARPRMQIWHGTEDTTLRYPNFGESVKQWTNVHGLSQTPAFTDQPRSGWTRTRYGSSGTMAAVEAISLQGVGHSLPLAGQAQMAIEFFGLNTGPTSSPPVSASPSTSESPSQPIGFCRIGYQVNPWNTGLTANITITNTGTAPINGWSLVFTLPAGQVVTSTWNATITPTSGQVTARNLGYNAVVSPGQSTGMGFNANHAGNTGRPPSFTLNGNPCQLA